MKSLNEQGMDKPYTAICGMSMHEAVHVCPTQQIQRRSQSWRDGLRRDPGVQGKQRHATGSRKLFMAILEEVFRNLNRIT